jgi:hypothetical protein
MTETTELFATTLLIVSLTKYKGLLSFLIKLTFQIITYSEL